VERSPLMQAFGNLKIPVHLYSTYKKGVAAEEVWP
jgi:hypothetical protein